MDLEGKIKRHQSGNYAKCPSAGAKLPNKLQIDTSGKVLFLPYVSVGTRRIKLILPNQCEDLILESNESYGYKIFVCNICML